MNVILWGLMAYGMTNIIVYGSIFEDLREWVGKKSKFFGKLLSCVLCTSTWVGFYMSICLGGLMENYFPSTTRVFGIFMDGMLTAGLVWCVNSVIEFFEEYR